jgi:hypothetical protein
MKAKALIIGNSEYPNSILDNPVNDANDIGKVLTRLGFEVLLNLNANQVNQDKSITDFATNLDDYDIALFYFAGHGFQINNENYLAAIDTNFEDEGHAKYSAFPLNLLLSYLDKSTNKTSIIILDACRELLNKKAWYRTIEDAGLAPIFAPKGTIIAYATSPGEKALDGTGQRNGVYTNALLQHITVENIPIEEMFKRVRNSVYAFSKGRQTSWEHTSLTGTFCFNSGQLAYSTSIEYSNEVVQDNLYGTNLNSLIDTLISSLKTSNWYKQNPVFSQFNSLNPKTEDKNKLFLLGRNILQAACGSSASAIDFMNDLPNEILQFNTGSKNHVLNGIIYETFFNSFGSYRLDNLKDCYIKSIYSIIEDPVFLESKKFLCEILMPFSSNIFYVPFINDIGVSLDLEFETNPSNEKILKRITLEGNEVLIKQDKDIIWGLSDEITFKNIVFDRLKDVISNEIKVPLNKLTLNSNIPINNNEIIKYPNNHKILK